MQTTAPVVGLVIIRETRKKGVIPGLGKIQRSTVVNEKGAKASTSADHPVPALPSGYSRPCVRGAWGVVQGRTFPPPYGEPRSLTAWPHAGRQWAQARAGTSGNHRDRQGVRLPGEPLVLGQRQRHHRRAPRARLPRLVGRPDRGSRAAGEAEQAPPASVRVWPTVPQLS